MEYARFNLETKHGTTVDLGNITLEEAVEDAKKGVENGSYYDVDYFTWDGEEINLDD